MLNKKEYSLAKIEDISEVYKNYSSCDIRIRQIKLSSGSCVKSKIYSFKERLKKYKFVAYFKSTSVGQFLIRTFIRILHLSEDLFLKKKVIYDLKNISKFCSNNSMEILFQSEKFYPTQLKTINNINDETSRFYKHQQVPANMHQTPEVYYAKITNVTAIGGSNFLLKNNVCLVHDQFKSNTDTTSEELHDFHRINRKEKKIAIKYPSAFFSLDKAAVFTDACSSNYAHWMTEVLPRIILFLDYNKNTDIDLVLDSNLHINMYKSLFSCLNKNQNIYLIDKNIHLNIKELHYISATSYVPFDFVKPFFSIEDKTGLEGRYNIKALIYTRDMLLKNNNNLRIEKMKEVAENTRHTLKKDNIEGVINILDALPCSRLYIERILTNKIVVNKYELDLLMSKYNFSKFDTAKATFSDQVTAFSNVDIVISNSSATLVNMMFMKPGSKLYILMANSEHVSYYYWQNQGDIFNIDIKFVLGSTYGKRDSGHPNFILSILDLEKELKKL